MNSSLADRALGAVIGSACGDALGAPYEFKPPLDPSIEVVMEGGSGWEPGEWTDDTAMAIPILKAVSEGKFLLELGTQDEIVTAWYEWSRTANDVGIQTRQVLNSLREPMTAQDCKDAAARVHNQTGRSGGNGSLMRTVPVAIAYLNEPQKIWKAANAISELTHFDPEAGEACGLWCLSIAETIKTGQMTSPENFLSFLPSDRAEFWQELILDAENRDAVEFENNGWVRHAFQAAWSINSKALKNPSFTFKELLIEAVRVGNDTDTVAAIAGQLLGAQFGVDKIPMEWATKLHGYPALDYEGFCKLAEAAIDKQDKSL
jgi:ADP-ribosylglycohydrolase